MLNQYLQEINFIKTLLLVFLAIFCLNILSGQTVTQKNRFRFAQSTIGFGLQTTIGGESVFQASGISYAFNLKPQLSPILHFGGMHFWGHAELYFAFPVAQFLSHNYDSLTYNFNQSDIFGVKIYPWKLKINSVRPYLGMAIAGTNYQQKFDRKEISGTNLSKVTTPLLFGVSCRKKRGIIELSVKYNLQNNFRYYISQTEFTTLKIPSFIFGLNYKWIRDGTVGSEKDYYSGKTDSIFTNLKKQNKLNSWFVAIGPSSSFFPTSTSYNAHVKPYLGQHTATKAFLDFGAGYYHQKTNAFLNFSYRKNSSELSAYGTTQIFKRQAITLEINKFLFDYQGFVPFLGVSISHENLMVNENESGQTTFNLKNVFFTPGVTFGWDILPTKLEYMTLRTNLRYYPILQVKYNNYIFSLQQLEFNFIQFVFYPQRFKWIHNSQ